MNALRLETGFMTAVIYAVHARAAAAFMQMHARAEILSFACDTFVKCGGRNSASLGFVAEALSLRSRLTPPGADGLSLSLLRAGRGSIIVRRKQKRVNERRRGSSLMSHLLGSEHYLPTKRTSHGQ
jgi:hypothetical protein